MTKGLSVIIVNYRSAELIKDCLNSALSFSATSDFEWIIVDNDSKDNSESLIKKEFPFVRWINMGYNSGFARANNEGIRHATGDYILLLNPDIIILDNAIAQCLNRFANSAYSACSVQLLYKNGRPQITGSYFIKGGLNTLFFLPYLGPVIKRIYSLFKKKNTAVKEAGTEQKVDWINGAFMMVKKNIIQKAGLFDEDFFLYAEEVEWCYRLGKTGEIVVFGDIKTIHLQGYSINSATDAVDDTYFNVYDRKGLQLMVSRYLRIRKQFGTGWFLLHLFVNTFEIPVFFICSFIHRLISLKNPFADISKIKGFSSNVMRLWSLSPTIISRRPHFYKMF